MKASQIDYQSQNFPHPKYSYLQILPQAGTQTVTVSSAGGQETIFDLPNSCYNLSKSIISFTATPSAVASNYNWMEKDAITPFRQVQFNTRGGQFLMDLQNAENYTHTVLPAETSLDDMLSFDIGANARGTLNGLRRNNNAFSSATEADTPVEDYANRPDANNLSSSAPLIEKQYCEVGSSLNVADPVIRWAVPLSQYKNTIVALDKDMFFNQVMQLRFVWSGTGRIGWYSNSATDPSSSAAAITADISMTNVKLLLAIEDNVAICAELKAQVSSPEGLNVLHDYVYSNKQSLSSTSQSVQVRYNRSQGIALKKIYHTVYNSTESANTAYDHRNDSDDKVSEFHTLLDNQRLQQFNLDTSNFDDYNLLKHRLKGTCLSDSNIYQYNWFWVDSWEEEKPYSDMDDKDMNLIVGLPLESEKEWSFQATTANATHFHYTFAVVQRMANIGPNGITIL